MRFFDGGKAFIGSFLDTLISISAFVIEKIATKTKIKPSICCLQKKRIFTTHQSYYTRNEHVVNALIVFFIHLECYRNLFGNTCYSQDHVQ